MVTRIVTALIALGVFFAVVFLNPSVFTGIATVVILLMLYECLNVVRSVKSVKILSYISALLILAGMRLDFFAEAACVVTAVYMVLLIFMHGKVRCSEIFTSAFITLYVTVFMSFVIKIRMDFGIPEMILIFLCAWMSDTGAYFAGTFLGKHKLIPHVSPKKTVEGSIGGVIVCALSCILYLFILKCIGTEIPGLNYGLIAIAGAAASVLTQLGDLAASAIKRDFDTKDYGNIFPGHGGFMDRFDSVIFIAPFIYYFIALIR